MRWGASGETFSSSTVQTLLISILARLQDPRKICPVTEVSVFLSAVCEHKPLWTGTREAANTWLLWLYKVTLMRSWPPEPGWWAWRRCPGRPEDPSPRHTPGPGHGSVLRQAVTCLWTQNLHKAHQSSLNHGPLTQHTTVFMITLT